jgi:uncharacterized Zn finger protein
MKCFCTSCGKAAEFFGESKRPKNCLSCGFAFASKVAISNSSNVQVPVTVSDDSDDDGRAIKNYGLFSNSSKMILEGEEYDKSFLLNIITMDYEKDRR